MSRRVARSPGTAWNGSAVSNLEGIGPFQWSRRRPAHQHPLRVVVPNGRAMPSPLALTLRSGGVPAFRLTMPASTRPIVSPERWWCSSPSPSAASRAPRRRPEDRARTRLRAARRHPVRAARAARRPRARARDVAAFARRGRPARRRALALSGRVARPADRRLALGRRPRRRGIDCAANRRAALLELSGYVPAPVLADLLGVHINTATRWAKLAGRHQAGYLSLRGGWCSQHPRSPRSQEEARDAQAHKRGRGRRAGARRSPISTCASAAVLVGLLDALRATATARRGTPARPAGSACPQKARPVPAAALAGATGAPLREAPGLMWWPARRRYSRGACNPRRPRGRGRLSGWRRHGPSASSAGTAPKPAPHVRLATSLCPRRGAD
jgi:hypothetical protein